MIQQGIAHIAARRADCTTRFSGCATGRRSFGRAAALAVTDDPGQTLSLPEIRDAASGRWTEAADALPSLGVETAADA
jgi:hypothetical protein